LGAIDETLGEGAESDENISNFKDWLLNNGARFDKIDWPSTETVNLSFINSLPDEML
jgi:hypothetical protein